MFALPADLQSLVCEFAGMADQWKRRFTCDVLPDIEQGLCMVGDYYKNPCPVCYFRKYNPCRFCDGRTLKVVSYQEMKESLPYYSPYATYAEYKMSQGGPVMELDQLDEAIWAWMNKVPRL